MKANHDSEITTYSLCSNESQLNAEVRVPSAEPRPKQPCNTDRAKTSSVRNSSPRKPLINEIIFYGSCGLSIFGDS